jgi:MarR family transcriptional regulator, organic hydroperoxide resistance regulator
MATVDDVLGLDQQLCFALYSASRAMIRAYQPLLEPLGITYPQYLTLLVLWQEDGVSVKRLGERLSLDSGTLTPLLQRLEAQGLVRKQRSDEDERVVLVHLTAAGRQLRAKAKSIPKALACQSGFDLSDAGAVHELAALRARLHALTRTLTSDEPPPAGKKSG